MSSQENKSASGIMSISRDWSDGASLASTSVPSTSSQTQRTRPPPQILTQEQRDARNARRMQMLEKTLAESTVPSKRHSDDASNLEPPIKRGSLVDSNVNASPIIAGGLGGPPSGQKPAIISVAAQITLSAEQQEILKLVTSGKNIFFTGSAGMSSPLRRLKFAHSMRLSLCLLWWLR